MAELASHGPVALEYTIVLIHSKDDRWIAQIDNLGVRATGDTDIEARSKAQAEALRLVADQIETDKASPDKVCFGVVLD
jgi:hypothetical protein